MKHSNKDNNENSCKSLFKCTDPLISPNFIFGSDGADTIGGKDANDHLYGRKDGDQLQWRKVA